MMKKLYLILAFLHLPLVAYASDFTDWLQSTFGIILLSIIATLLGFVLYDFMKHFFKKLFVVSFSLFIVIWIALVIEEQVLALDVYNVILPVVITAAVGFYAAFLVDYFISKVLNHYASIRKNNVNNEEFATPKTPADKKGKKVSKIIKESVKV